MKRIKNSFSGVILGIIFLIVGSIMIFINEKDAVNNAKTVKEIEEKVITVSSDKIESQNEGKIILTNGKVNIIDEKIVDDDFNVGIKAIKLYREVEVYQWEESSNTDEEGNTTYTYKKVWSKELIDSSKFDNARYKNPTVLKYDSTNVTSSEVRVGNFILSDDQKSLINTDERLNLEGNVVLPTGFSIKDNYITDAVDLTNANIGDIRISYYYNDWKEVSVLAVQKGNSFIDFKSSYNKSINRVEKGILNVQEVLTIMVSENNFVKWLFRGFGALLIIFGYVALLGPLSTLTSFVPILGGLASGMINLIGVLIGIVHTLIVFVISWLFVRPLLAIILIVICILIIIWITKLLNKNKSTTVQN